MIPTNFRKGDRIRAQWMNSVGRMLNDHDKRLHTEYEEDITDANRRRAVPEDTAKFGAMPTSLVWTKSSEQTASRVGTDSNGDTETYDVATQLVMTASHGGQSYSWTFNLPT